MRYTVKAYTPAGESCTVLREGRDEKEIALALLQDSLTPIKITPQDGSIRDWLHRPVELSRSVALNDIALFCEQLSAMLSAGLTVEQSLKVVVQQGKQHPTARLATTLLPQIQGGASLSDALASIKGLPSYLSPMVLAAETGGRLGDGLDSASRYLQRQVLMRNNLKSSLTYPAMVLGAVMVALTLMLTVVVPSFAPVFDGEEARLPTMTRWVVWISDMAVHHMGAALLGVLLLGVVLCIAYTQVSLMQHHIMRFAEKILPVRLLRFLDVSRALGVAGMLFDAGVGASEAMSLAAHSASAAQLRKSLEAAARDIRAGRSVTEALRDTSLIPESTMALIEVGEHIGKLGATVLRAAHLLETESANRLERVVALINPLAIVFLGIIVGLVVGGVMLGILSINQLAMAR